MLRELSFELKLDWVLGFLKERYTFYEKIERVLRQMLMSERDPILTARSGNRVIGTSSSELSSLASFLCFDFAKQFLFGGISTEH